jgi:hypothetical protein
MGIPDNSMRIPRSLVGVPIAIYDNEGDHGPIATHGGVAEADGVLAGLTASHLLNTHASCEAERNLQVERFEADLQEDTKFSLWFQAEHENYCEIEIFTPDDMEQNGKCYPASHWAYFAPLRVTESS